MKKSKVIIPAMAMILFSTAASISGTVAWFTASRVFNTTVGNFSVVEVDGSLECTMAPVQGTILENNAISVRNDNITAVPEGTSEPAGTPKNGDLWIDTTTASAPVMKEYNGSAWAPKTNMVADALYVGTTNHKIYKASSASAIVDSKKESVDSGNPVVLTHGSVDHTTADKEGHAFVINGDDTESFVDKGIDTPANWRHQSGVTIKNSAEQNVTVDVFNAVSWTMKFTYNFASDTTPVAVYLDMAGSEFTVPELDPNFVKPAANGNAGKTKEGFRVGFYGDQHDVVWGNHEPVNAAKFDSTHTYAANDYCIHAGKIYRSNSGGTGAWSDSGWTETPFECTLGVTANSYSTSTPYVVDDMVSNSGKIYQCIGNTSGEFAPAKWVEYTSNLSYVNSETSTSDYTANDYVWHHAEERLNDLAEDSEFTDDTDRASRICVLTSDDNEVTIKCAAWFEGTDPNVITGASMDCLKATMKFYSRTVTTPAP